ncbi:hypothetical protein ES319_A04G087700v1 [Gossypium barbadense]|uniref:Thaumatin-like protein n=3 Tax=Gossypium TaxID=3633 RepID=A0A5J5W5I5_GOSBA|nr:hypothetical protein ES319_A04G087700v1 [Gossypium barbadense]TYH22092.1 hypothetical protein ES288_A04G099400v1 [Gossypium darwinii]TYI32981.1 hypothetical protein ES332_A04G100300v1 [Gossypium tomentosum]
MGSKAIFSLVLVLVISGKFVQSDLTFNFDNECSFSVWLSASPSVGDGDPERGPGTLEIFSMPDPWTGSLWLRTKCSYDASQVNFTCETGDCGSGSVDCQSPPPKPPETLLNFNINQNVVSYEVSLNHGFNVPVQIQPIGGTLVGGSEVCPVVDCIKDMGDVCPPSLVAINKNRAYVGCNSPCDALKDPKYCCTGSLQGRLASLMTSQKDLRNFVSWHIHIRETTILQYTNAVGQVLTMLHSVLYNSTNSGIVIILICSAKL